MFPGIPCHSLLVWDMEALSGLLEQSMKRGPSAIKGSEAGSLLGPSYQTAAFPRVQTKGPQRPL